MALGFEGYSFKIWAIKNKDNLKLIFSGILGLVAVAVSNMNTTYTVTLAGLVTVATKLGLDAIEYWFSTPSQGESRQ